MGEEMLDLLHHDLGQITALTDLAIIREGGVDRHAKQLLIAAMLVFQIQHRDRARTHDATGHEGRACDHQCVQRIAIGRQRVGHEAVIGGIAHRRVQDAVHEQRAAVLVELIFHRLAAHRDFDDDVERFGRIVADGDLLDIHGKVLLFCLCAGP